ncbi:MAG: histidine phosphatase family protein, partial [Bacillota bacterium]
AEWPLSPRGEQQALALADVPFWGEVTAIYSSPEPKAVATVTPAPTRWGLTIHLVDDLRELERPPGLVPDYEAAVAACFAAPERSVGGWEPAGQVQRRMTRAIRRLAEVAGGRPIAVASHGLSLALFLAGLEGRPAPSLDEWRALPMPGWALLDLDTGRLIRPFSTLSL